MFAWLKRWLWGRKARPPAVGENLGNGWGRTTGTFTTMMVLNTHNCYAPALLLSESEMAAALTKKKREEERRKWNTEIEELEIKLLDTSWGRLVNNYSTASIDTSINIICKRLDNLEKEAGLGRQINVDVHTRLKRIESHKPRRAARKAKKKRSSR